MNTDNISGSITAGRDRRGHLSIGSAGLNHVSIATG
jgi:hypothetical protein